MIATWLSLDRKRAIFCRQSIKYRTSRGTLKRSVIDTRKSRMKSDWIATLKVSSKLKRKSSTMPSRT